MWAAERMRPLEGSPGKLESNSSPNNAVRRWAPYSRHVLAAVQSNRQPNVYIFACPDAWHRAEQRHTNHGEASALVLPTGEPPEAFRWPALDSVFIVALGHDQAFSARVARAVYADGTRYACAVCDDAELIHCWHEGAKRTEVAHG